MRPDVDAIRKRAEAATQGPWSEGPATYHLADAGGRILAEFDNERDNYDADLLFAAHARADVPVLVAYIAELEEAARRLRAALRPFARLSDYFYSGYKDDAWINVPGLTLTAGHVRAAARAIAETEPRP